MGWPIGPEYSASSNVDNAHRLQGRVLLVVGEKDTNVDPSSTMQVVNALVKANKTFDLLVIPGAGHGPGGAYGERKRYDFFVQHLLGVTPPAWRRIRARRNAAGAVTTGLGTRPPSLNGLPASYGERGSGLGVVTRRSGRGVCRNASSRSVIRQTRRKDRCTWGVWGRDAATSPEGAFAAARRTRTSVADSRPPCRPPPRAPRCGRAVWGCRG
jgi:hypothetical protein